jgi:hypothetical protein
VSEIPTLILSSLSLPRSDRRRGRYFSWSLILSRPARAQASLRSPPGAPAAPIAPTHLVAHLDCDASRCGNLNRFRQYRYRIRPFNERGRVGLERCRLRCPRLWSEMISSAEEPMVRRTLCWREVDSLGPARVPWPQTRRFTGWARRRSLWWVLGAFRASRLAAFTSLEFVSAEPFSEPSIRRSSTFSEGIRSFRPRPETVAKSPRSYTKV